MDRPLDDRTAPGRAGLTVEERHRAKVELVARRMAKWVGPLDAETLATLEAGDEASLDLWLARLDRVTEQEARDLATEPKGSAARRRAKEQLELARFTPAELVLVYTLQSLKLELAELDGFIERLPAEVIEAMRSTAEKLREQGREEGHRLGMASVLERLLTIRFGELDAIDRARLQVADEPTLTRWAERLISAESKAAVFG